MSFESESYDVIVAGGGQAGIVAAIVAAEKGASVCLLEGAPRTTVVAIPVTPET